MTPNSDASSAIRATYPLILRPGGAWRGSGRTLRDISAGDNCRAGPVKERFGRVQKSIKKSFSGKFKTAHLADIANLSGQHASPRRNHGRLSTTPGHF